MKAILKKGVGIGFNKEGAIEKRLGGGLEIRFSEGELEVRITVLNTGVRLTLLKR